MNGIKTKIRSILLEELPSLVNPLDQATDAVALSTSGFGEKVTALVDRNKKEKKEIEKNIAAKKKVVAIPQGSPPDIERQRRNYANREIDYLEDKKMDKGEEEEELKGLTTDVNGLSKSVEELERERMELEKALADMQMMQRSMEL
jgi:hypothetical protein